MRERLRVSELELKWEPILQSFQLQPVDTLSDHYDAIFAYNKTPMGPIKYRTGRNRAALTKNIGVEIFLLALRFDRRLN